METFKQTNGTNPLQTLIFARSCLSILIDQGQDIFIMIFTLCASTNGKSLIVKSNSGWFHMAKAFCVNEIRNL